MPKRIDRHERFELICRTAARIVAHEGLAAASLRRVAAEAGLNLNELRHLTPTQAELHRRTALWLKVRFEQATHPYWNCDTPEALLAQLMENLVPSSDEEIMWARAWASFRRDVPAGSLAARVVEVTEREQLVHVRHVVEGILDRLRTAPREGRLILAGDVEALAPGGLHPGAVHALALGIGLTSLVSEHRLPLTPEALDLWLRRLEPRHLDFQP